MQVNVPSKCTCVPVLFEFLSFCSWPITKVQWHFNQFPAIFPSYFFVKRHCTFVSVRRREITQVHLLRTLTGMHSRTQWCITNEKSLGPFAREARGPGFSGPARAGPLAARPIAISTVLCSTVQTSDYMNSYTTEYLYSREQYCTLFITEYSRTLYEYSTRTVFRFHIYTSKE